MQQQKKPLKYRNLMQIHIYSPKYSNNKKNTYDK